jgi:hypothetical protein
MSKPLFAAFLSDAADYSAVKAYWRELILRMEGELGQRGWWRPWQALQFADGTPFPPGNPVLALRSRQLNRAIRIIQLAPAAERVEIAAWMDTLDFSDAGGPGPTDELVINLALSETTAAIAARMLRAWMVPDTTISMMNEVILSSTRPQGGGDT